MKEYLLQYYLVIIASWKNGKLVIKKIVSFLFYKLLNNNEIVSLGIF
jgi:hypothetical protein